MTQAPADIFFFAGEPSGDLQASLVAGAMRLRDSTLRVVGVGGDALAASGAQVLYRPVELASLGIVSLIPRIPYFYAIYRWLARWIEKRAPKLLVPVDLGGVNLPLLRRLRKAGYQGRVVYYFPPGAWLDNPDQARAVAAVGAIPVTPFAHQRDFYQSIGIRAEYFGHPLVSVIHPRPPLERSAQARIALMPGSRRGEISLHLPILAGAAAAMLRVQPASFTIIAASQGRAEQIRRLWRRHKGPEANVVLSSVAQSLDSIDLAWTASGTAVLETALRGVPQLAFYRVPKSSAAIARRYHEARIKRGVTLPNLVLDRRIVPEIMQEEFNPAALVEASLPLLQDDRRRQAQLEGYEELRAALGPPDALQQIASFMLEQLHTARRIAR